MVHWNNRNSFAHTPWVKASCGNPYTPTTLVVGCFIEVGIHSFPMQAVDFPMPLILSWQAHLQYFHQSAYKRLLQLRVLHNGSRIRWAAAEDSGRKYHADIVYAHLGVGTMLFQFLKKKIQQENSRATPLVRFSLSSESIPPVQDFHFFPAYFPFMKQTSLSLSQ